MSHIIISRCHPVQYYGIRLLILLLAVVLLWGAFELGYMQSEEDIIEAKGGRNSLLVQQKVLKKQNKELNKELLHLERKYLLEQESSQIIKSAMSQDQQRIAELEKELVFYKGIVSPAQSKQSLYLQSLEINPLPTMDAMSKEQRNRYQYKFVLAQKVKKRNYTKGTITIYIKGKQNDKPVKLSMISLLEGESKDKKNKAFKYSFKYFQEFTGIINLPQGMIPQSVDIKIDSKKKQSIVELNDLSWSKTEGMQYVGK